MVVSTFIAKATTAVGAALSQLYEAIIALIPNVIASVIIILVGMRLAKWAVRYSGPVIARAVRRPSMIDLTLKSIKYLVLVTTLLIALSTLGIDLTPLFTAIIASSVIIGIIIAPVVSSYLGGIFLLVDRPFEVGDRIEIAELKVSGFVTEIGFRVTRIFTMDGNLIVIPNTEVARKNLINYSAEELRTRRDLPVMISYESNLKKATEVMLKAAREVEGVVKRGELSTIQGVERRMKPAVLIQGFGDNGLDLVLRVWYKDPYYLTTRDSEIYTRVFRGFQKEGVEIPYPHRDLTLKGYISTEIDKEVDNKVK